MATFVDHYAVLGIKPTANTDEIKKAYRQLALRHHPDKAAPGSKPSSTKFISVQAAYEVLVDAYKRKAYDNQYRNLSEAARPSTTARVHKQATCARQPHRRGASGCFDGGFWSHAARDGEEINIKVPGDYPSDDAREPEHEWEDTDVYEDAYADPRYTPWKSAPGGKHNRDEENTAPRSPDPVAEAFENFGNIGKSHDGGEKVMGRSYQNAMNELRLQKAQCNKLDTQLDDIDARLRRRVETMPTGSVNLEGWDETLKQRMALAHRAVRRVRLVSEDSIFTMRFMLQPTSWMVTDTTTRCVISRILKNAGHINQIKNVLSGLDYIVMKMQGWKNADLQELQAYLGRFMFELRQWCEEITSRP